MSLEEKGASNMALSKSVIDSISKNFIIPSGSLNPPAYSWNPSPWGMGPLFITEWAETLNKAVKDKWGDKAGLDGSSLICCGATIGNIKGDCIEMYLLLSDGRPILMHHKSATFIDDVHLAITYHIGKSARDLKMEEEFRVVWNKLSRRDGNSIMSKQFPPKQHSILDEYDE